MGFFLYSSCEELEREFYRIKTPRDIAQLLEVPYSRLVYYIYKLPEEHRYKIFEVPKRLSGFRKISSPKRGLLIIQKKLSQVLYAVYRPRPSVHGFTVQKSILTNARAHTRKNFVLNLDLENFFGSINFGRVRGLFISAPYNIDEKAATVLAQICCHQNQLPQGAPTSPVVSNMICSKMDRELQVFSEKYGLFYTRYADDLTFSTTRKVLPSGVVAAFDPGFSNIVVGNELRSIIESNGFKINISKARLSYKTQRQKVTGLIVNKKVNINRKYIRNIYGALHAWEVYGLDQAVDFYSKKYSKKSTLPGKEEPDFLASLYGKIEFVGSVRGKNDLVYQKLLQKFILLRNLVSTQPDAE